MSKVNPPLTLLQPFRKFTVNYFFFHSESSLKNVLTNLAFSQSPTKWAFFLLLQVNWLFKDILMKFMFISRSFLRNSCFLSSILTNSGLYDAFMKFIYSAMLSQSFVYSAILFKKVAFLLWIFEESYVLLQSFWGKSCFIAIFWEVMVSHVWFRSIV